MLPSAFAFLFRKAAFRCRRAAFFHTLLRRSLMLFGIGQWRKAAFGGERVTAWKEEFVLPCSAAMQDSSPWQEGLPRGTRF